MAKRLPGQYSKQTKAQNRRTVTAQFKADLKSGKMKVSKNEVPFGGLSKAALKYATRTGARIITDRQGARIIAEKAERITRKTSDKVARAAGREAAGPKAKGPGGRPQLTRNNKSLKGYQQGEKTGVAVRTGNKPGQFKNTERVNKLGRGAPERVATATEKEYRAGKVSIRYESPKKLKAAAKARKEAPRVRRENVPAPSRNVTPRKPAPKNPWRARDVNNLGSASRVEKKIAAKQQAKLNARKNRKLLPSLVRKNEAAVKRAGVQRAEERKRIAGQVAFYNDKTPIKSSKAVLTNDGKIVDLPSKTTRGEVRQRNFKLKQSAANPKNLLRGEKQETIESRSPRRAPELSAREIEILRKVGKRDYSRGEVNTLAQSTVQREADDLVAKVLRDPRVRAQDAARDRAAIQKTKQDKSISRTIKGKQKNFRGKPMKK